MLYIHTEGQIWFNYSSSEGTTVLTTEGIKFWHNPISGKEC